jgi:hypothetical protein
VKPSIYFSLPLITLIVLFALVVAAQQSPTPAPSVTKHEVTVSSGKPWTDAGTDLHPGDTVSLNATAGSGGCHSEGTSGSHADDLPLANVPAGALIAKLASDATPVLVGAKKEFTVQQAGHLYLGMNSGSKPVCKGDLSVNIEVTPGSYGAVVKSKLSAAAETWLAGQLGSAASSSAPSSSAATGSAGASVAAAAKPLAVSQTPLDTQLAKDLQGVPRRVNDEFKNLGDMVNFVIVGSQDKVQGALTAADWHVADKTTQEAVVKAVLETYEKKDYLQMPMSTLYLFDRPQDFGYEQAEPYAMVASRHHFRIWKAPFTWNGQTVWVGAGTHDIGFEKDQRNGKVTHKIDPAVDGERDNIGESLEKTGLVKGMSYFLPSDPVRETKNATGGSYHSDGRLLVIFLK